VRLLLEAGDRRLYSNRRSSDDGNAGVTLETVGLVVPRHEIFVMEGRDARIVGAGDRRGRI